MITVIATIQLKPGCREAYLARLQQLVPAVLHEPGCLKYQPLVDAQCVLDRLESNPDQVMLLENWSSIGALEDHLRAPHMQAYRQDAQDWVESVKLRVLESI
ncbi:MAG TPA: putative quinol monooxygenase [Motiliproteus sp.]